MSLPKRFFLFVMLIAAALFLQGCSGSKMIVSPESIAQPDNSSGRYIHDASSESFHVSCKVDKDRNTVRYGGIYPLVVDIDNKGQAGFEGVARLMLPSDEEEYSLAFVREINVAAGESVSLAFDIESDYIYDQGGDLLLRLDLLDVNGNHMLESGFIMRNDQEYSSDTYSAAIICDKKDSTKNALQFVYPEAEYIFALDMIRPDEIKETSLSPYRLILMTEITDGDSGEKVSEYVINGGFLMISRNACETLFPDKQDKEGVVRYGAGRIFVFDPGSEDAVDYLEKNCSSLLSINNFDSLIMSDVLFTGRGDYNYSLYSVDLISDVPEYLKYILLISLYLVIMCPLLYFFLKKKDKMEYIWAAIPVLSILFCIIVYNAGAGSRMRGLSAQHFSYISLSDEARVERSIIKTTNPSGNAALFTVKKDYDIKYFNRMYADSYYGSMARSDEELRHSLNALMESSYKMAMIEKDDASEILLGKSKAFSVNDFMSSKCSESAERIETDLQYWKGMLSGSVKNSTEKDLHDIVIIDRDFLYYVGDMLKGEERQVKDLRPVYQWGYYGEYPSWKDIMIQPKDFKVNNYQAIANAVSYMISGMRDSLGDSTVAAGFTSEGESALYPEQFDKIKGLSMYSDYVSIDNGGEGWGSIAPIWGEAEETGENQDFYDAGSHMMVSDEVTLVYDISNDYKNYSLCWINCEEHEQIISFFNNRTKSFDDVMLETEEMEENELKDYLDKDGKLKLRVSVMPELDTGDYYRAPAFCISGGERND